TVSGVESPDIDIDPDDLEFGRNRRKKLVRWFTLGLVLLVGGVTWVVVSSQLRGRDHGPPEPPTAPPTSPLHSLFDPIPSATLMDVAPPPPETSASAKASGKPKASAAPGTGRPRGPRTHNDGSVEIPDDPGLPPPAP